MRSVSPPLPQPSLVLLVEDNPGDAHLFGEMLTEQRGACEIVHAARLHDALDRARAVDLDAIVLDLGLPDCDGLQAIRALRAVVPDVPIVVLTGSDDDALALACIDAGAQDYLTKGETRSHSLRRAIGYATSRLREAQVRELTLQVERYRALSTATQETSVTAAMMGSGAVSVRSPAMFAAIVREYLVALTPYLAPRPEPPGVPRDALERIITMLGDVGGGPRDLVDIHVAALDRAVARSGGQRAQALLVESRLLALEMMGLLVDYYRVGYRRRFQAGDAP